LLTAPLSGNLGNNIQIYTITRIVADKLGYQYGFNRHPNHDYYNGTEQLSFLNLDYGIEHNYGYDDMPPGIDKIWNETNMHYIFPNGDEVDYHPYCEDIWQIEDGTKLMIPSCQDARYFKGYEDKICEWLRYKPEFDEQCKNYFENNPLFDDNTCILNIRGGEYKGISKLLIRKEYYFDAINKMKAINPKMHFVIISDDPTYASNIFNNGYPCFHFGIGADYWLLNHAKNLILSNSSFAILPTFTNKVVQNVFAPAFWSRHNISTGYWASTDMWTFKDYGWNFINREGELV